MSDQTLSAVEGIKARSRHLRGTIAEGLRDRTTGALAEDDTQLIKFHGMYQQDDRDLRKTQKKFIMMVDRKSTRLNSSH